MKTNVTQEANAIAEEETPHLNDAQLERILL
jgi:hypothetical protein